MDKTELSGVVNSISKSSTDNGISIKTECTRKNSPGIENKIPECDIIIPETMSIEVKEGEQNEIPNPTSCSRVNDTWFIKFVSNVIIDDYQDCYIELKTYDINSSINNDSSENKEFPYIGRYWDLVQYLNDLKPKLVRIQHAYSFCPNVYGIQFLNLILQNWNIKGDIRDNISEMLQFLEQSKQHLSIEIYPLSGQAPIITHNINGSDVPYMWSDIFDVISDSFDFIQLVITFC